MKPVPPRRQLERYARRGFRGYPVCTVAFYGPDPTRASKVAVAIVPDADAEPTALERWTAGMGDVRTDWEIGRAVLAFLDAHRARSVVLSPGIIGCPHEEGVDYPHGTECPRCPYWQGKDRWAGTSGRAPPP
jgi:hypothetical protein